MSATAEMLPTADGLATDRAARGVVFVTPHKATFLKPLYEAFAESQPRAWRTSIIWPRSHRSEHPLELLTPFGANLQVRRIAAGGVGARFLPGPGLAGAIDAANPRLVVIQEYSPFSVGALWLARRRKLPVVVITEVGRSNGHFYSGRTRWWHALCGRFVDGIAAACPAAHEPLCGRALPSVATYHAVDSRSCRPLPARRNGPVTFAYLGQLISRKGLDLWVEAARRLRLAGHENFRLRIIGGGDENWVRGLVRAAGLEDKAEWRGFLSGADLREALGTADVFVLPTRRDTYAAVVHEAACLGLPMLVSRHAGAADVLVRDGENGFVVDPVDARDFAQRMRFMLDARLRARMGAVSREVGDEFSAHRRGPALWHWMEETFLNQPKLVAR